MEKEPYTVKPVLLVASIKQATCIKQACILFLEKAKMLKCTCINQACIQIPDM